MNEKNLKIDKYYTHDNLRRFFLTDMLRRKSYLKLISIENLNSMVNDINTLVSNLNSNIKDGKMMIKIEDRHNWSGSTLFQNIILHNVLDVKIDYNGSNKDFKNMLKERWKAE